MGWFSNLHGGELEGRSPAFFYNMDLFINVSSEILILLFITGFFSGFVDSIAGGGGLISVPVLMATGMPPQMVLGTNKLQSSFGAFSSVYNYTKKGVISIKECTFGIVFTVIGAAFGSFLVQQINPDFIRQLIPFLLIPIVFYSIFSGSLDENRKAKLSSNIFFFFAGLVLGFYDGFFGPGTGTFWTAAFVYFMGFELTKATGATKVMNFTSNIVALSLFFIGGNIDYKAGFVMAAGSVIGARIGSNLAAKKGSRFIRPVFITVVLVTIASLFYQNYRG